MPKKHAQRDTIRAYQRKATASRRVGADQKCAMCGEARPEALIAGSEPRICAECQRKEVCKSTLDVHHVAGKSNSPVTIPVPANDHRAQLTPAQYDWPERTLENRHRSPLLAAAARMRGYDDTTSYLREKLMLGNPEMLEALDVFLLEKLGPEWWIGTPLQKFAPEGCKKNVA